MVDVLFLLAITSFGLGLSLFSYRFIAMQLGWPMGMLHRDQPLIPIILGFLSFFAALCFAIDRGAALGGWAIVICGLLLALFWTGFLRVGSQMSLFLAPVSALALVIGWLGARLAA